MSAPSIIRHVIWSMPLTPLSRRLRHSTSRVCTFNRSIASYSVSKPCQGAPSLELIATSPLATQLLAHYFASSLKSGDSYLLFGEVGAGKSYFSRSFIRACLHDESAPIPSPTFLLQNTYRIDDNDDFGCMDIHHFDLYRLDKDPKELGRLELERSLPIAVSLIEWPERLGSKYTPEEHLAIKISIVSIDDPVHKTLPSIQVTSSDLDNDDDLDNENDDTGDDCRWRRFQFWPSGPRWEERIGQLSRGVASGGTELGLLALV